MSAEVVKKRGRPKKVITDAVEVEMPEGAMKATTRAKSTKASIKPAKPPLKATTSAPKASPVATTTAKSPASSTIAQKNASKQAAPTTPKAEPPRTASRPVVKVTPESSKILDELRQKASEKTGIHTQEPAKSTKPFTTPASSSSKAPPPQPPPQATPPKSPHPASAKPIHSPPGKLPLAEMNRQIVSEISARAGARPAAANQLPKNYKSVARKVTLAIVAMPIAIVTSWVLYERCKFSLL
jgi:hypothetical protein